MSTIGKLNLQDLFHAIFVAVLVAVVKGLEVMITKQGFNLNVADLQQIGVIAVTTALTVLVAAFGTDAQGHPLGIGTKSITPPPAPPTGGSPA